MSRLSELEEKLAAMRKHECSYDERESMCSVCADMDGIEHEIARLKNEKGIIYMTTPKGTSGTE